MVVCFKLGVVRVVVCVALGCVAGGCEGGDCVPGDCVVGACLAGGCVVGACLTGGCVAGLASAARRSDRISCSAFSFGVRIPIRRRMCNSSWKALKFMLVCGCLHSEWYSKVRGQLLAGTAVLVRLYFLCSPLAQVALRSITGGCQGPQGP